MKRIIVPVLLAFVLACELPEDPQPAAAPNFSHAGANGFDEFGYNYRARVFVGQADGVDRNLDGTVWGDPTYGNDHLKMSWSRAWDEARFHGANWNCDAWTDNQWNGQVPDGSGETWHYRIVWVGPSPTTSPCWRDGGYPIWGEFEVIMSHGTVANEHFWDAHAVPTGFGGPN